MLVSAALLVAACSQRGSPLLSAQPASQRTTEQAAEAGDIKAQLLLATKLRSAPIGSRELVIACDWFGRAAEGGSVKAMVEYAKCLEEDILVDDRDKSLSWWRRAAEKGDAESEYTYGTRLANDEQRGIYLFGRVEDEAANANDLVAWLTKAAKQKYLPAVHALGMIYLLGVHQIYGNDKTPSPIAVDKERGISLLKEAAAGGYWKSQWALAILYQAGYAEIKPDKSESDRYWALLDKQSSAEALDGIVVYYYIEGDQKSYVNGHNKYKGSSLDFRSTNLVASQWLTRAAELHDRNALYTLALLYRDGRGVWTDTQKYVDYLKQAAEQGNYSAMGDLAVAYAGGKGVVRDYSEALRWLHRAVNEGATGESASVNRMRYALGLFYEKGWGTAPDPVLSYAWYNVSAAAGYDDAEKAISRVEGSLTADQLSEAQALSKEWRPGYPMTHGQTAQAQKSAAMAESGTASSGDTKGLSAVASGSAFSVTLDGYFVTNYHVINGCREVRVPAMRTTLSVVVSDETNDLALLKSPIPNHDAIPIAPIDSVGQGEDIYVFGYPLDGYLPASGNITPGIVSALAGPANNSSLIQITAPVQPGNSGGPVLSAKGQVVGVVVGKADAIKIAKAIGDIPQNINFAISLQTLRAFLDGNRVPYETGRSLLAFKKDAVSIADLARDSTVKVECWR